MLWKIEFTTADRPTVTSTKWNVSSKLFNLEGCHSRVVWMLVLLNTSLYLFMLETLFKTGTTVSVSYLYTTITCLLWVTNYVTLMLIWLICNFKCKLHWFTNNKVCSHLYSILKYWPIALPGMTMHLVSRFVWNTRVIVNVSSNPSVSYFKLL